MKSTLGHLVYVIAPQHQKFYRDLFTFLGWQSVYEVPEMLGLSNGSSSVWFGNATKSSHNDYDAAGLNHLGIHVDSIADVDATVAYLKSQNVKPLFETPRHRPEFSSEADKTYYQVMFESPDRILFEIVYIGPK